MTHPRLQQARQEWRQNRRLRLGTMVVVLVLGVHLVLLLSDRQAAMAERYAQQADMLARLQDASREAAWPERATQAEEALAAERATIPAVPSAGLAQAELQAWLTAQGEAAQLQSARVTAETTLDVPGHPDLWQVIARIDAEVPAGRLEPFLLAASAGLPWIQAEQLDVTEAEPMRMGMIVRGYYQRADADAGPDGAEGDAAGAASTGAPAPGPMDAAARRAAPQVEPAAAPPPGSSPLPVPVP